MSYILSHRDLVDNDFCSLRFISSSPDETRSLGEEISRYVLPGSFFFLYGDLGSGKTEFARGFARGCGWYDVRSPSFTIVNEYPASPPIIHVDLYRVNEGSSFEFALEEHLRDGCVVLIEWAERMDLHPINDAWEARFHYQEGIPGETAMIENIRVIDIACLGERSCGSMKRLKEGSEFIRMNQKN